MGSSPTVKPDFTSRLFSYANDEWVRLTRSLAGSAVPMCRRFFPSAPCASRVRRELGGNPSPPIHSRHTFPLLLPSSAAALPPSSLVATPSALVPRARPFISCAIAAGPCHGVAALFLRPRVRPHQVLDLGLIGLLRRPLSTPSLRLDRGKPEGHRWLMWWCSGRQPHRVGEGDRSWCTSSHPNAFVLE